MTITAAQVKELRERTGAGMMECKKALVEADGDLDAAITVMREKGQAKADKKSGRITAEGKVNIAVADDGKTAVIVEINSETDFVARDENFVAFVDTITQRALQEEIDTAEALLAATYDQGASETVEHARQALISKIGENVTVRRVARLTSDGMLGAYQHGARIAAVVAINNGNPELCKDLAMHIAASNPQAITAADIPKELVDNEREIFMKQAEESGKPIEIVEKMVQGRIKKFEAENCLHGQAFIKDTDKTVAQLLGENKAEVTAFTRFEVGEGIEKKEENFAEEVMAQARGES